MTDGRLSPAPTNDFWVAPLVLQALARLVFLGYPDCGTLAGFWWDSCVAFWVLAAVVVAAARGRPNRAGRLFIQLGWVALVPAGLYLGMARRGFW